MNANIEKSYKEEFEKIGERIRHLRKENNWSQDNLIEEIANVSNAEAFDEKKRAIGRNTLSNIENGNFKHFELSLLYTLAYVFKRDVGHLLCIYDEVTKDAKYVQDYTGLSHELAENLHRLNTITNLEESHRLLIPMQKDGRQFYNPIPTSDYIRFINHLLSQPSFYEVISHLLYSARAEAGKITQEKEKQKGLCNNIIDDPARLYYISAKERLDEIFLDMYRDFIKSYIERNQQDNC